MNRALLVVRGLALATTVEMSAGSAAPSRATGSCRVTIPIRTTPPDAGFSAVGFNHGGRYLRSHVYWPDGIVSAGVLPGGGAGATINPDGSIRVKIGWWRGLRGVSLPQSRH
jgi:hypothetical protein